jgi:hypothetical protein
VTRPVVDRLRATIHWRWVVYPSAGAAASVPAMSARSPKSRIVAKGGTRAIHWALRESAEATPPTPFGRDLT